MLKKSLDPKKLSDLLTLRAIERKRPLACTFELTYKCNFKCRMCYIRMTDEQARPYGRLRTVDEWIDMARQVREAGVVYLQLTGGECTTFPGFPKLYETVWKMGFRVSLMSNAGAYTDEIRELFRKFPPYSVSITLYGGTPETYERVTGDANGLEKAKANIKFLQSINVPVNLSFTITKLNVRDYPKVGEVAVELGLPFSLTTDITAHNRDASFSEALECRLSPAERATVACHPSTEVDLALERAKELEKELENFTPPTPKMIPETHQQDCITSKTACAIFWNGDMQTCVSLAGIDCYKSGSTAQSDRPRSRQ